MLRRVIASVLTSFFTMATQKSWFSKRASQRMKRPQDMKSREAKFGIGQVVKHRRYAFRGIVYDVDPEFANTEEWWEAIPEDVRPRKDQPFYHLYAENAETEYVAYVSEQNLLVDESGDPVRHPQVDDVFVRAQDGGYLIKSARLN